MATCKQLLLPAAVDPPAGQQHSSAAQLRMHGLLEPCRNNEVS
jgi:hypothetical protein